MADTDWGGIIQWVDGFCYGITPNGRTICCGKEADVKATLADPAQKATNPLVNDILNLEIKLLLDKETEDGKPGDIKARTSGSQRVVKTSGVRTRPTAYPKHKPFNTRRIKTR